MQSLRHCQTVYKSYNFDTNYQTMRKRRLLTPEETREFNEYLIENTDYTVYRRRVDLDSPAYMEVGCGIQPVDDYHIDGNLFIEEHGFGFLEGVIYKHFSEYDHYGIFNNIPIETARLIVNDWKGAVTLIHSGKLDEAFSLLNLRVDFRSQLDKAPNVVANLLHEVVVFCDEYLAADSGFYIPGA